MSPDREALRESRREAMKDLATALRRLTDVAVCTDLPPDEVRAATRRVEALTADLAREQHDGPYSGLLPKRRDYDRPHYSMPLSPIIGELNPIRPEVQVELREGRVYGTAVLGKKFVGPAGFAHGGVTAMICDQLVALAARAAGLRGLTASLEVRYRRPTPLYRELSLEGLVRARRRGARGARFLRDPRGGQTDGARPGPHGRGGMDARRAAPRRAPRARGGAAAADLNRGSEGPDTRSSSSGGARAAW